MAAHYDSGLPLLKTYVAVPSRSYPRLPFEIRRIPGSHKLSPPHKMRLTYQFASFLLAAATLIKSTLLIAPIEGYTISKKQWLGEFQGQNYNVPETVQERRNKNFRRSPANLQGHIHTYFLNIKPSSLLLVQSEVSKPALEARWNQNGLSTQNFPWAAAYAQVFDDTCSRLTTVRGKNFDDGGYNIVVRRDKCKVFQLCGKY
ncbi:uncharacterized protein RSE6_01849 [Rhynchosporium secalis]|uniref:Uncharacterized protein n=1 Tax=Rhynchosporium secalis TaxID=38038 RepID=A0A1E1LYS8_RHYSE|nr:uncharacterized protein RSE6_01849 [Rhynchosporium secalis]